MGSSGRSGKSVDESDRENDEDLNSSEKQLLLSEGNLSSAFATESSSLKTDKSSIGIDEAITNRRDSHGDAKTDSSIPPLDRFKIVFIIMVIHGMGELMPWQIFFRAQSYFLEYKIQHRKHSNSRKDSPYTETFMLVISLAGKIPQLIFCGVNTFVTFGGDLETRTMWAIVAEMFLVIVTSIFTMVNTRAIPGVFYALIIFQIIVINMAAGIHESSVFGLAARFDCYGGAALLGNNICGLIINIMSTMNTCVDQAEAERSFVIHNFLICLITLLLCFDTLFVLTSNKFYRYYKLRSLKVGGMKAAEDARDKLSVLKKSLIQCLNVFLVFVFTLSVTPEVIAGIERSDGDFFISEKYFAHVTCFITFDLFAMVGNAIPFWFQWPSAKYLWIPILLRCLFIPFFIFCRYKPAERTIPVLITNDWIYWSGNAFLGLTSGYYSSLAMIYCTKTVEIQDAHIAGMFSSAFLVLGVSTGVSLSTFMKYIVTL